MRIQPSGRGIHSDVRTRYPIGISQSPKKRAPTPQKAPLSSYISWAVAAASPPGARAGSSATVTAVTRKAALLRMAALFMRPKAASEPAAVLLTVRNSL
jgi:hypothetical protein